MKKEYILSFDQGTTSSRTIAFDKNGYPQEVSQLTFKQYYPYDGWVEHDGEEIWLSQIKTAQNVIKTIQENNGKIAAIGISNQRETVLIWDRKTGKPIYNAIVWQDRRTAQYCDKLKNKGYSETIKKKTGLVIDPYFSGTKIKWLLDNIEGLRNRAEKGEVCCGTVDTWLLWNLTGGKQHITDVTNASRTMLYNIHTLEWDEELLTLMDIPRAILPNVRSCSEIYGHTDHDLFGTEIPISGMVGDQQSALFGHLCTREGMVKNTYGTGCFLLMNTGEKVVYSENNLLTTIAWKIGDKTTYALEGSVFVGGAAVEWIRDGLDLIEDAAEIETLALQVKDNGGVYFVPALTGLGAPHWDPYARGAIYGLTRGTTKHHIARAALEGIAFQVYDIVKAMESDSKTKGTELRVDGGAVANDLLMQYQADLFQFEVQRPQVLETTALGAAYFAGLAVGFWESIESLQEQWKINHTFSPKIPLDRRNTLLKNWGNAVARTKNWIQ